MANPYQAGTPEAAEWEAIQVRLAEELLLRRAAAAGWGPARNDGSGERELQGLAASGVLFGPDVAGYQGKPDWVKVKASGCALAIWKVSEGRTYLDPSHAHNRAAVPAAGLVPGCYHFLYYSDEYAADPSLWAAQARWFVQNAPADALHVLDVEAPATSGHHLGVREWVAEYRRLLPGHRLGVYTNRALWQNRSRMPYDPGPGLFDYAWHAGVGNGYYTTATGTIPAQWAAQGSLSNSLAGVGYPEVKLWQITDHATVPGITSSCDGNAWQGAADELRALITTGGDHMSPLVGADYSAGRPGGAALAAAGVKVVGRYAAAGRTGINISAAEVRDLRAHGIDIFVYNEHEASYMLGGAARAATVAPGAVKVCRDAGLPDGPIFYAVDYDATRGGPPTSAAALADMRKLADFLTGAARATSWGEVGVYGGYYVIGWLLDNLPNLKHAVQTSAWSAGRWDPRAFCRQDGYNWMINGVNCDHLTVVNPDEGSLRYRTGVDDHMSAEDVAALKTFITSEVDRIVHDRLASPWVRASGYGDAAAPGGLISPVGMTYQNYLQHKASLATVATAVADDPSLAQIQQALVASAQAQAPGIATAVVAGIRGALPTDVKLDPVQMHGIVAAALDEHLGTLRIVSDAPHAASESPPGD